MKTLNLDQLSEEASESVTAVLGIITNTDETVLVEKGGKAIYSVAKVIHPSNETLPGELSEEEEALTQKYAPRPGEDVGDVIERILEDGPIFDEKYQNMSFEEFRREAWGGRGVR